MASVLVNQRLQPWQTVIAPYSMGYRQKLLSQLLERRLQEKLEPHGLTPFHWLVLCCLWEEDGLATSSIGDKLCQVGGTLTGVLDRMEERNLIERRRDLQDRRVWRIWLTEAGRQMETILPPIVFDLREQALQGINDAERQRLSALLDLIIANLN